MCFCYYWVMNCMFILCVFDFVGVFDCFVIVGGSMVVVKVFMVLCWLCEGGVSIVVIVICVVFVFIMLLSFVIVGNCEVVIDEMWFVL